MEFKDRDVERQMKVGDEVIVRLIAENHHLDRREKGQEFRGRVVYVHEAHRYAVVDFTVGNATVHEAFKPDDMRPAAEKGV